MTRWKWLRCASALFAVGCNDAGSGARPPDPQPGGNPRESGCSLFPVQSPECSCREHPEFGWCRNGAALPGAREASAELVRAAAMDVLAARCAECHSSLSPVPWEPAAIDDVAALVEGGQLVPLNSAASLVYQRSQSGEMPPPDSGRPPLSQAELDILALWIDTPSFWPQATRSDCDAPSSLADFDLSFQLVSRDLEALPSADQKFYRYLSLTNRANAACTGAELEGDRQALIKGLNMLSLNPSVHAPIAIDPARQIYRIDVRDFDWARGIDVGGQRFADVWEAIAAVSPYSVEFSGEAAALVKQATAAAFPVLFANQVLDRALTGELYYAILGLPRADLGLFSYEAWGIDPGQDLERGLLRRAGTWDSRVSRGDRVLQREALGGGGVLWQAFDIDRQGESVFESPLDFSDLATEAIFTLPNGLFGFVSSNANDAPVSDTRLLFDTLDDPLPARTPVSCSACHASGLIPVVDQVKNVVVANVREIGLNSGEQALLEKIYAEPAAFFELVVSDTARYYGQALERLQLPSSGGDPVAAAALRFDRPLTLRDAAGELGVLPEVLAGSLSLAPWLAPLASGTLDRDAFAAVYVGSLCVLSEALANHPDPAACDRALAALRAR